MVSFIVLYLHHAPMLQAHCRSGDHASGFAIQSADDHIGQPGSLLPADAVKIPRRGSAGSGPERGRGNTEQVNGPVCRSQLDMMMLMIVAEKHELGPLGFENGQQHRSIDQRLAGRAEARQRRMMNEQNPVESATASLGKCRAQGFDLLLAQFAPGSAYTGCDRRGHADQGNVAPQPDEGKLQILNAWRNISDAHVTREVAAPFADTLPPCAGDISIVVARHDAYPARRAELLQPAA